MFTYCSFAISWVLGPKVSLDIFVSTLTDDEAAQFDRAIVERAFRLSRSINLVATGICRRRREK